MYTMLVQLQKSFLFQFFNITQTNTIKQIEHLQPILNVKQMFVILKITMFVILKINFKKTKEKWKKEHILRTWHNLHKMRFDKFAVWNDYHLPFVPCYLFPWVQLFIPTVFCMTCVGWLKPIHLSGKLQTNLLICSWLTWVIFIYDPLVKYIQTSNPTLRERWRITQPSRGES